jgi:2-polyprenyl-3-methyl-5-hydroxy-6-metoxy-1,4-benzoquinol methylase
MEDKTFTAAKFTARARGWSEREYGDPLEFMRRRAALVRHWGTQLQPGERILELGCGDGALSCLLAAQGFDVMGVDISPGMIAEAKRRAERESVAVNFEVADSDSFASDEPFDAVISFMSAFFTYLEKPAQFLERIMPLVKKKVIVDWNFRSPCPFNEAARTLERAGLHHVEWRPWLIPHTTQPATRTSLRAWLEERPNLSLLLLNLKRWHYTIHIKGEKLNAAQSNGDQRSRREFKGNTLPGSFLQRSLIKFGQLTR